MKAAPSFAEHVSLAAGTSIHHIEAGEGSIVLLIHGSLCDYRYWRWQIPAFSAAFRVVAPSLPGCWPDALTADIAGRGTENRDKLSEARARFNMDRHVQAMVELCAQLSPSGPVHLVGHSRGAQVALETALAMPERVGRLVLADPGFPFAGESPVQPIHAKIVQKLGTAPLEEVMGEFVDNVNGPGTWRKTVAWFKDMVCANAWTLLPQLGDIHRTIDIGPLAQALDCPILLVGGEFSPRRYGDRIEGLMKVLPQARHIVVPQAAHGMNLANARCFNDAVLQFLRKG